MTSSIDLVIVGAGPAGMAAAAIANELSINTVVLDDQPKAGGQIYRNLGASTVQQRTILGSSYTNGETLLPTKGHSTINWVHTASVWQIDQSGTVFYTGPKGSAPIKPKQVILANGALERPMPFPGWTLPGVMTAGAVQIALKSAALVPDGKLVLAGSGPLLYLLAIQLVKAGADVNAIVDTTPRANSISAASSLLGMARSWRLLREGIGLLAQLRQHKIKHYRYCTALSVAGDQQVQGIRFTQAGNAKELSCDILAIHNGVVPNVQLSRQLGLKHDWQEAQRCWAPRIHNITQTELPWLHIAGDGAGILGAEAAALQGRLAAFNAARALGANLPITADQAIKKDSRALARLTAARRFIDKLYAPADEFLTPANETVVCRCEETTAGEIREFVAMGCTGPNQAKAFGRPGMGPCQGRYCGLTVSEIIAKERGVPIQQVGYYRIRPPIKPITLAELAALPEDN